MISAVWHAAYLSDLRLADCWLVIWRSDFSGRKGRARHVCAGGGLVVVVVEVEVEMEMMTGRRAGKYQDEMGIVASVEDV